MNTAFWDLIVRSKLSNYEEPMSIFSSQMAAAPISLKDRAAALLAGVDGVRGIGFSWDDNGDQRLRVDIAPGTDRGYVEKRLKPLETEVAIREVSGRILRN